MDTEYRLTPGERERLQEWLLTVWSRRRWPPTGRRRADAPQATPAPIRKIKPIEHGTAKGYWRGCGCAPCANAAWEYGRSDRARRQALRDASREDPKRTGRFGDPTRKATGAE